MNGYAQCSPLCPLQFPRNVTDGKPSKMNSTNTSQMQPNPTGESESTGSGGIAGAKQRIKVTAR